MNQENSNQNIDIINLNEILFRLGADFKTETGRSISKRLGRNYIYGFFSYIYLFVKSLIKGERRFAPKLSSNKCVLYFGNTVNNQRVLEKIYNRDVNPHIIINKWEIPLWKQYYYSLFYIKDTFKQINNLDKEKKEVVKTNFVTFFCTHGIYRLMDEIISLYEPTILVMANDHSTHNRCLLDICNKKGIDTIYVQHASVTEKFPALSFTYSFLDGFDSLDKYLLQDNNKGNIYVVGGVRFDGIRKKPNNLCVKTVGIALNEFDDLEIVGFVVEKLRELGIFNIVLRPHPARCNTEFSNYCSQKGLIFSNSRKIPSYDFLYDIDVLLANDSSIHLDAVVVNCPSYVYNFSRSESKDWYGYVKHELVKEIKNIDDLKMIYEAGENNLEIIKYYYAAYGTPYERNVSGIILEVINSLYNQVDNSSAIINSLKCIKDKRLYKVFSL